MKKVLCLLSALIALCSAHAQVFPGDLVVQTLPYTWEAPFMNGKIVNTLVEDGTIYSQSITPCTLCYATGVCQVCQGTGGQYWYGMGIRPCGRCLGSGKCASCYGRGINIINYQTSRFGGIIGYDEHGNCYVSSSGSGGSRGSSTRSYIYDCCSSVPTFGQSRSHSCKNCGEYHTIGSHKCVRR